MKLKHQYYECPTPCIMPGCQFCDGGLLSCTVCGGGEGQLTTDCSGERQSQEKLNRVYAGEIDFRDGAWINEPSATMAHTVKRKKGSA